jgi:5-methylcytosine-specific restriction endonuclease McrA
MPMHACLTCGRACPTSAPRCAEHQAEHEAARNNRRRASGQYDRAHAKQRAHGRDTSHWRKLRREVLARDGNLCQRCGGPGRSVHLNPALAGRHDLATASDCLTLCTRCHGAIDGPRAHANRPGGATAGGGGLAKAANRLTAPRSIGLPPLNSDKPQRRQSQRW